MVVTSCTTPDVVDVLGALLAAVPTPAAGPLVVAIDGRSGAGKTDLAGAVAGRLGAAVVHLDDLYPGWGGLAAAVDLLGGVLDRLRTGAPTTHPVWDWAAGRYAGEAVLPTSGVVVVEGVGAGCARPVDLLVELVAEAGLRRDRALARDGATFAPHWQEWAAQEAELFSRRPLRPDVVFTSRTRTGALPTWTRTDPDGPGR